MQKKRYHNNEKSSYTTSINRDLIRNFKIYCSIKGLYQNEVIEGIIDKFLNQDAKMDHDLIEKIKSREKRKKGTDKVFTTSISNSLSESFRKKCDLDNVYQYEVLEEFIKELLREEGEGIGNTN